MTLTSPIPLNTAKWDTQHLLSLQSLTQNERNEMTPQHLIAEDPKIMNKWKLYSLSYDEMKKWSLFLRIYYSDSWKLTPEQVLEIQTTGQLCNQLGYCINFSGSWGSNCCPFG
ncbi:hypothetical protein Pcinc_010097 [Petrolisthes cinctipes]|uniref:Uncharacterized protein n=1 Tax=Petrolisthes cinctipes TaxID=88211 RepID=A0AAE1KU06_PETCI|nr:hypothetical protein Pcinc_010097 [Petrolisthes cinctipes]